MRESSDYSMREFPKWYPLGSRRRRLVLAGRPLTVVVMGDEIGLQLKCGECTLLATSYDYFDGCEHWIYLLGSDGSALDFLGMPDGFGFIENVKILSPTRVEFKYFGMNSKWNLDVYEGGFWSYEPSALLRRINRFFVAKRYLRVQRTEV